MYDYSDEEEGELSDDDTSPRTYPSYSPPPTYKSYLEVKDQKTHNANPENEQYTQAYSHTHAAPMPSPQKIATISPRAERTPENRSPSPRTKRPQRRSPDVQTSRSLKCRSSDKLPRDRMYSNRSARKVYLVQPKSGYDRNSRDRPRYTRDDYRSIPTSPNGKQPSHRHSRRSPYTRNDSYTYHRRTIEHDHRNRAKVHRRYQPYKEQAGRPREATARWKYCTLFNTHNGCKYGMRCARLHPRTECRYHFRYGRCRNGTSCTFSHHRLKGN